MAENPEVAVLDVDQLLLFKDSFFVVAANDIFFLSVVFPSFFLSFFLFFVKKK